MQWEWRSPGAQDQWIIDRSGQAGGQSVYGAEHQLILFEQENSPGRGLEHGGGFCHEDVEQLFQVVCLAQGGGNARQRFELLRTLAEGHGTGSDTRLEVLIELSQGGVLLRQGLVGQG